MARLPDSERRQVGMIRHSCGQVVPVFQNRRLHLYTHCAQCGFQMDSTAAGQTAIFEGMTKSLPFTPPRNLIKPAAPAAAAPESPAATETAPEVVAPKTETPTENPTETEPKKPGGSGLGVVLILLGLLGASAAIFRA